MMEICSSENIGREANEMKRRKKWIERKARNEGKKKNLACSIEIISSDYIRIGVCKDIFILQHAKLLWKYKSYSLKLSCLLTLLLHTIPKGNVNDAIALENEHNER